MEYSSKQLEIILATLKLLNDGKEIDKVTVKDIADCAKIGKGSVYDHFNSKEEIIKATIIKSFEDCFTEMEEIISTNKYFKDKVFTLYDLLIADIKSKSSLSILNLLASSKSFMEVRKVFQVDDFSRLDKMKKVVSEVLMQGVLEKEITKPSNMLYAEMVVFANLTSIGRFVSASHLGYENNSEEKIKENAYLMLMKALN